MEKLNIEHSSAGDGFLSLNLEVKGVQINPPSANDQVPGTLILNEISSINS